MPYCGATPYRGRTQRRGGFGDVSLASARYSAEVVVPPRAPPLPPPPPPTMKWRLKNSADNFWSIFTTFDH